MVLAGIIQYVIFFVMIVLLYKTIGEQFIASITFLGSKPDVYMLPAPPIITMLTSVIPGGLIIPLIITVTFLAWIPPRPLHPVGPGHPCLLCHVL